jgi:chaperonin GroES
MMNSSGIEPLGSRVLIKPLVVEQVTKVGIILAAPTELRKEQRAQDRGEVIAVASGAWADQPGDAWCKPGDNVVFARYAGNVWQGEDGIYYRLVNDLDIVAKLSDAVEKGNG